MFFVNLPSGTSLYRYNVGNEMPPINWSIEFHSPEYVFPEVGIKNQIGAFFFYNNENTAHKVLEAAIKSVEDRGNSYKRKTITLCQTTEDIRLLDLANCVRPVQLLNRLYDEGIDVLNVDFVKHLKDKQIKFDTIRDDHLYIMQNEKNEDGHTKSGIAECATKIDDFFRNNVGYTGQLLTDFENGIAFKKILQEKGYEGYLFDEEGTSPTICLLESSKLSEPIHCVV